MTTPSLECGTGELERRLYNKYHGDDFALCFNVRNDAGFSADRTADALGIGLWPSRGCRLYGFEIKASRPDWLKELKNGAKAEAFIPYCDYWYILAGSRTLVADGELPDGWGLLVPRADGLKEIVPAKRNDNVKPMPRGMLAAFVKRASERAPNAEILRQAREEAEKRGFERGKQAGGRVESTEQYQEVRRRLERFKTETGIDPEFFFDGPSLKRAVALVRTGKNINAAVQELETLWRHIERIGVDVREAKTAAIEARAIVRAETDAAAVS